MVKFTFYLSKDKIQYRHDHLFAHRTRLHNHTMIHCRFNMSRKQDNILAIRGYMLTRHNLVVARNTTLEEVSCKVNEYSVSENTLYIYVLMVSSKIDCQFFPTNKQIWKTIFCSNEMKYSLTREHLVNNG